MEVPALSPMRAMDASVPPFTDPAWLYEIKFDGYRTLAYVDQGRVALRTKNGADCTSWFPEVVEALAAHLPHARGLIIDAETCVLDTLGRSDFNRLQDRARKRRRTEGSDPVTLMAFDLLAEAGKSLLGLPLVDRKARLQGLMADMPARSALFVGDFPADALLFKDVVLRLELEGFMAKRRASPYTLGPTRSRDWLKVKRKGAVPTERFRRLKGRRLDG